MEKSFSRIIGLILPFVAKSLYTKLPPEAAEHRSFEIQDENRQCECVAVLIFYKYLSDREVKFLRENDFSQEDIEGLDESDPETMNFIRENIGYFIAYQHLFSTWLKMERDFDISNVRDALSAFSRLINVSHKKVFSGIFKTLETGLSKLGENSVSQTKSVSSLI